MTTADLSAAINTATADWTATGLTPAELSALATVEFQITNLDAIGALGLASTTLVQIDNNAAGYGWYTGDSDSVPADQVDLLTVIAHELGHVLGHDHEANGNDLMSTTLGTGTRHAPTSDVDNFFSSLSRDGESDSILPFE